MRSSAVSARLSSPGRTLAWTRRAPLRISKLQNLAGASLGRDELALAVDFDRGGQSKVLGERFGRATGQRDPPDGILAEHGEIDIAIGSEPERVGQRQVVGEHPWRAAVGETAPTGGRRAGIRP